MPIILALLMLLWSEATQAATYYASPSGSGTTCSSGSPCTTSTGLNNAGGLGKLQPGDTLILKNGTYTGSSGMLFVNNIDGNSSQRITIQAETDGSVTLNGQAANVPIDIVDSSYVTVTGFNAYNSSSDTCKIRGSDGTPYPWYDSYVELKRTICWDAVAGQNRHVINITKIQRVLVEDVGAFGTGRKTFGVISARHITVRRCWTRWNQSSVSDPKQGADLVYNTWDTIWENCIFEWDRLDSSTNLYGNANSAGGVLVGASGQSALGYSTNMRVLGSIGLVLTGQGRGQPNIFSMPGSTGNVATNTCTSGDSCTSGNTFRNVVGFIEPASTGIRPFSLSDSMTNSSDTAENLTSITGTGGASSVFNGNYSCTNCLSQATVSTYNLYANPPNATGATIRYRYVDGTLTNVLLWPWPMASRIAAALTAGGYSSHNIDTVIQAHFGTFPTEGGSGSPTLTQTYGRFENLRGTEAAPEVLTANKTVPGGRFRVRLKIACTVSDCAAISPVLRYSRNGGAYTAVPAAFGADNIRLYPEGIGDDVPSDGSPVTEQLTSDHATNVLTCALIRNISTTPAVDLVQNSETECVWVAQLDTDVAPTDTFAFRAYADGTNPLDAYTVSPTMTVEQMSGGVADLLDWMTLMLLPVLGRIDANTTKPSSNFAVGYPNVDQVTVECPTGVSLKTSGTGLKRTVTCVH
jgi:hypothetical protein